MQMILQARANLVLRWTEADTFIEASTILLQPRTLSRGPDVVTLPDRVRGYFRHGALSGHSRKTCHAIRRVPAH